MKLLKTKFLKVDEAVEDEVLKVDEAVEDKTIEGG